MANLMQYMDWRGDLAFTQAPFNEVDNLILTQLSFVDFTDIVREGETIPLKDAARIYFKRHMGEQISIGVIIPKEIIELFRKASASVRYGDVGLRCYVNHVDTSAQVQFSAVTAVLGDGTEVVSFRGTDDTIVGWKEDFNMAFRTPVPAQLEAMEYVRQIAESTAAGLRIVGHSKGGNLAIYSAAHSAPEVRARILGVYNDDGPGFSDDTLLLEGYQELRERIQTIVPQASLVGMLLEHDQHYTVVRSTTVGIMQHNGFSWEVLGGKFVRTETDAESARRNEAIHTWIAAMTPEQREQFTSAFFNVLQATKANTLTELVSGKNSLLNTIRSLKPEDKKILTEMIRRLRDERRKVFLNSLPLPEWPPKL